MCLKSFFTREKQILALSFIHGRFYLVHFIQKPQSIRPIVSRCRKAYDSFINKVLAGFVWVLVLDTIVTIFTWLLVMFQAVLTELHLQNRPFR